MPCHAGIDMWIEVDGVRLLEYQPERVNNGKMTCHVASQEGKKFSVLFQKVEEAKYGLGGDVYLDGMYVEGGCLEPDDMEAICISGQTRLESFEAPFLFARLATTDDETEACRDSQRLKELGTIRVQMEWVTVRQKTRGQPPTKALADVMRQPIYERSKKASSHCTSLGDDVVFTSPKEYCENAPVPGTDPVEFIVHYAPLDWLRAKGIAPMPAPLRPPDDRKRRASTAQNDHSDLELLDPEELVLYRRLKDKMAQGRPAKRVKQEPCEPRSHPEVVDLTGDD